jgi:hypothetical protein
MVLLATAGGFALYEWLTRYTNKPGPLLPDLGVGCPDIPMRSPEEWAGPMKEAENGQVYAYARSGKNCHLYGVCVLIGHVGTIAERTGLSQQQVMVMLENPAFWQGLWAASVPRGAQFANVHQQEDGGLAGEFILTPGEDHVEVRHLGVGRTKLGMVNSFIAKTKNHHALRGTVQHNLIVRSDGSIFLCWEGAGGGGPTGGSVNMLVALNARLGMWPNVAFNATGLLADPKVVLNLVGLAATGDGTYFEKARARALKIESLQSKIAGTFSHTGYAFRLFNEKYNKTDE